MQPFILKTFASVPVLVALAACGGGGTSPDTSNPAAVGGPAQSVVVPAQSVADSNDEPVIAAADAAPVEILAGDGDPLLTTQAWSPTPTADRTALATLLARRNGNTTATAPPAVAID